MYVEGLCMLCVRKKEVPYRSGLTAGECLLQLLPEEESTKLIACFVDGVAKDLATVLEDNMIVEPIFSDSTEGLDILRHSTAHIMACAVKRLYPEAQCAIGPAIENGFYYDFAVPRMFTQEDLPKIELEMGKIIQEDLPFICRTLTKEEAIAHAKEQQEPYKVAILEEIESDVITLYACGDFEDICRGPHIPRTGCVPAYALLSVAGAYWRGEESNAMLSRIYGTAFPSKDALESYLAQVEEAKRRDHRKLGTQLALFGFEENVATGMVFWYPRGMMLRIILEDFLRKEHLRRGYEIVQGPQLLRSSVWEASGHYANYRENMYFSEIDAIQYGVKPMNCVGHMYIYRSMLRSYRDLPVRFFELGVVHRHEKSGVLHGLMRVRQFTQDDAHIICTPEQLPSELIGVIRFVKDLLAIFGFEYTVAISTKPEKYIGSDAAWDLATSALIHAVEHENIPYTINEGDGAFYGPKIDVQLVDSLGRKWQCSTIQCDFTLPERFDLYYIGEDGEKHRPVMVHRAILGSIERFIGILIENYAGAFPLWLAPEQVRIVPVSEKHVAYAKECAEELQRASYRVEVDTSDNKLGYKVRQAQLMKIPYILVVGDAEIEGKSVNVRLRSGENLGMKSVAELIELLNAELTAPFLNGGTYYKFA